MHPASPSQRPHRPLILVVDDEDELRRCIELLLEEEGYAVLGAPHGGLALELVRQVPPDLIVLDVQMPHVDGRGFARAYRQLPGPHAPIVLLTASDMGGAVAAEIGAVSLVAKPFDIDALVAEVRACLGAPAVPVSA